MGGLGPYESFRRGSVSITLVGGKQEGLGKHEKKSFQSARYPFIHCYASSRSYLLSLTNRIAQCIYPFNQHDRSPTFICANLSGPTIWIWVMEILCTTPKALDVPALVISTYTGCDMSNGVGGISAFGTIAFYQLHN